MSETLVDVINELINGITDVKTRTSIAGSIIVLANYYAEGIASEEDIRKDLKDIVTTTFDIKGKDITQEDVKKEIDKTVEKMVNLIKAESVKRRLMRSRRRTRETDIFSPF